MSVGMTRNLTYRIALVIALASHGLGCAQLDEPTPPPPPAPVEIDETLISGWVSHYRDPAIFDQVSGTPYPSALSGTAFIQVYVSRDSMTPFSVIAPELSGSEAVIPAGGIIVREVLDANKLPLRLTVMAKGPAGYNPHLRDWYFAVSDLQGVPLLDKDGVPRSGRMTDCYGCHVPRAADDYLFGVPMDDRAPAGSDANTTQPPPE